jgi:spermidine synthase
VIVVDFPDPTNFSLGKLYTTSFYQRSTAPGGWRLPGGADHLAADGAAQLLDRGGHAGGGGTHHHALPRPCAQLRRMGLHRRRPAAVPRADGAAAGAALPDARRLPALLQFPPDMARVPAEPNRLSNQVLVHTFEEEWGRVQR